MRISGGHVARTVVAVLILACAGRPGDSPSGFDVASEFAKVASAAAELSRARARLDSALTEAPVPDAAPRPGEARLKEAQAAFDATYSRTQKVLARFLTVALNEAPGRPETKEALDLYAREAVSNGRYTLAHGGDRATALKGFADVARAYRALGLGVPREVASAMEDLRRNPTPTPAAGAGPAIATAAGTTAVRRWKGRHPAVPDQPQAPR